MRDMHLATEGTSIDSKPTAQWCKVRSAMHESPVKDAVCVNNTKYTVKKQLLFSDASPGVQ